MNLNSGFLYPKNTANNFRLVNQHTIGYISDNVFYKLNLSSGKAETSHHPGGRTYQAFTANHKRGISVLADYGKNSSLYFEFSSKEKNFTLKDICPLDIKSIEISLDGKYLAVVCGSPSFKLIIVDIENQKVSSGNLSFIDIKSKIHTFRKVDFNPSNRKIFSIMYDDEVQIFQIKNCFEMNAESQIEEAIIIKKKKSINLNSKEERFQTLIWDEINNVYISNGQKIFLFSTDTEKEIISYDLEEEAGSNEVNVISNFLLTLKHLIVFYTNGKIEWLIKYYPDLMEEEDASNRPFQLDKFYQAEGEENSQSIGGVKHSVYDHFFQNIYLSHSDGYFTILPIPAETNEPDEESEDADQLDKQKLKVKKIELAQSIRRAGPYHTCPIILIKEIEGTSLCVTVSTDGRIILWSLKQKKQITFYDSKCQVISADINKKFNVLALGLANGIIKFYSIANFSDIFLFKEFKLTEGTHLDKVVFSTNGDEIAILSKAECRVYYIITNLQMQFQVLGYVLLSSIPVCMCWNNTSKTLVKAKYQHLLVGIGYGVLMINSPPAVPTKKRGKDLELQLEVYAIRTDLEQHFVGVLPSGQIITSGQDKLIKKYKQPQQAVSKVDFKGKVAIPAPLQEMQGHDLAITFMQASQLGFVSGGADGSIQLRDYDKFGHVKVFKVHGWKQPNIRCISRSNIPGVIYSGGNDGCLQIWRSSEGQITIDDIHKVEELAFKKINSLGPAIQYYQDTIEQDYLERMKDVINNKKKVQFEKLHKIKKELLQLLSQNDTHDQLQKLSRDQFAIDLESRQEVAECGRQKCLKIREESKRKILYNEVYAKKLKQITWDRMEVHLKAINGLKNNFIVYNYQLRKIPKEERRKIKLVLDLRKAQKRQMKKRSAANNEIIDIEFYRNKNIVNGGVTQPLILTTIEKKDQKKEEKGKKKKEDEAVVEKLQLQEEIVNEEEWGLLYTAFQLFSNNSKRNQIIMMQNIIIKIKETFNKEFEKLMKFRQNQNEIINDKNKRIIQICEELKRNNQVIVGNANILESSDHILQVNPNEILFKRYLSKEEREKLEKERLKEEARLKKLAEDDASQRALQKMMSGTLEEKKTSVLEINVERQKWMDKPVEEMSEEQKSKMKEYEQKKQKAQQEKERIVKKLEAELRKLKLQIEDIMDKYDQRLFNLLKRRIEYDYRIEEQELYCVKLYLSMVNFKEESKRYKVLQAKIQSSQHTFENLTQERQRYLQHEEDLLRNKQNKKLLLQDMKKFGENQSKIKTIQKTVFQEYNSNLKKRREMEEKLLEQDPSYKKQLIVLDPMKQIESKNLAFEKSREFNFFLAEIKVLQQSYDIPEGSLLQILQNRFNIRKQQVELEAKLKILKDSVQLFDNQCVEDRKKLSNDEEQLKQINIFLEKSKSDLDIQCRIKQGQVEIDNNKPVPELYDALLIAKGEIDQKNANIMVNANQKIKVMEEIKTCKISVTEETLNLEKKEDLITKLSNMIKEIQMLKVKKEMQVALSKKDTKINENQIKSLKEQIQKVRKEGQKRISLFENKIEKILSEIESIKKENKQLESQRWNLDVTVKQKEKIKEMMVGENGQGNSEAKEKFQQIAINRKLFDKAKQQTQEIELLREELSKLKAKTFANFSNVQR